MAERFKKNIHSILTTGYEKIYNEIVIKMLEPHQFLITCSTLLNITLKLNEKRPDVVSGLFLCFNKTNSRIS